MMTRRIALCLLGCGLLAGLPSCRSVTVLGFYLDGQRSRTFTEPGFTVGILAYIEENVPNLQSVTVTVSAKKSRAIEVVELRVRTVWMEGGKPHAVIPYDYLGISSSELNKKGASFFRYPEPNQGRTTFSLQRLGTAIPVWWRRIAPAQSRSYDVNFSKPGCHCIPKRVDRIDLEISLVLRLDGQLRRFSRKLELKPKTRQFREIYNLKSGAWNTNRCR